MGQDDGIGLKIGRVFCFHTGPDIVIHHDRHVLEKMNDWSREQHTKSGLIQLIEQSQTSLMDAENHVIDFLKKSCPFRTGVLAGNSVFVDRWSLSFPHIFNRFHHIHFRFIEKYMPRLHAILHPSLIDCMRSILAYDLSCRFCFHR